MFAKRKICAIFLCAVMLFAVSLPSYAATFADTAGTNSERAVELLSSLGIVKGKTEDAFVPNDNLTRAEMTTIVLRLIGMEGKTGKGAATYADVPEDHWAYSGIMAATDMGIVNGISETQFAPDEPVTMAQLIKMLVIVLGYEVSAEAKGGYPSGYLAEATHLSLYRGVSLRADALATRGEMAILCQNTLETELFEKLTYGEDSYAYQRSENTLLGQYFHVSHYTAILEATYDAALSLPTRTLEKQEAYFINQSVGGRTPMTSFVADCGAIDVKPYFGAKCDVYIKSENNEEDLKAVAVFPTKMTEIKKIAAEDILADTTADCISYEQGDALYKAYVSGARIVYNGQVLTTGATPADLSPAIGSVTLVSYAAGDTYDVVIVESYTDYVVESVHYDNNTVYFADGDSGYSLVIDVEDTAFVTDMTDTYGQHIEAYNLYPDDVLSMAVSKDGKYRKIVRSDSVFGGVVTEKSDDSIVVDGTEYILAGSVHAPSQLAPLAVGQNLIFYQDFLGNIAQVKVNRSFKYGYLVNAATKGGLDKTMYVKIFTEDGEMHVFECADRVSVNGMSTAKDDVLGIGSPIWDGTAAIRQLVRYEVNEDGKLKMIETAADNTLDPISSASDAFSWDYRMDSSSQLVASDGTIFRKAVEFVGGNLWNWAGKIAPRAQTKIFLIPKTASAADDQYTMGNYLMFEHNDMCKDLDFYDTAETFVPGAIVSYLDDGAAGGGQFPAQTEEMAVIQKVSKSLTDDGDIAFTLNIFTTGGVKKSLYVEEDFQCLYKAANADIERDPYWYSSKNADGTLVQDIPGPTEGRGNMYLDAVNLMQGDVIQYVASFTGEATAISVKYRASYAENVMHGGIDDVTPYQNKFNYYLAGVSVGIVEKVNAFGFIGEGRLVDKAGRYNGESSLFFFPTGTAYLVDQKTGACTLVGLDDVYKGDVAVRALVTNTHKAYFIYRDWEQEGE